MALTVGAVTLGAYIYGHERWFGGRLAMPAWARVTGWTLIGVSTVFGWVAHH